MIIAIIKMVFFYTFNSEYIRECMGYLVNNQR